MRDLLQEAARHGITVFLTSHILSVVEQIATQLVMIRHGKMVWDSPVRRSCRNRSNSTISTWWKPPVVEELEWLGPRRS